MTMSMNSQLKKQFVERKQNLWGEGTGRSLKVWKRARAGK